MRICVISSTVFSVPVNGYSGLEHLCWQIAKGLAAKGHQVTLVAPDGSTCPGVGIIPTGPAGQHDERAAYGGYKARDNYGREIQYPSYWQHLLQQDVIIDHSWQKFSFNLKQEGRLNAPILAVCHAPINTMYQSLPPVDKPCFVCISQDQADHFRALFSRDCRVAYNGIDVDNFYKPLGLPRTDRYLFLARFSTIKGPHIAIEICQKADVGLDLIGDTSITNEPEYLARCKAMVNGSGKIKLIGPATRSECVYWFSRAHCLLHCNKIFREPLGLAPLESQACGTPVIAFNNGAMRETILNGETGWLCNTEDEMLEIIKNCSIDDKMRKRCREQASLFSEQRMVNRYEELCKEAMETGGW